MTVSSSASSHDGRRTRKLASGRSRNKRNTGLIIECSANCICDFCEDQKKNERKCDACWRKFNEKDVLRHKCNSCRKWVCGDVCQLAHFDTCDGSQPMQNLD